MKLLARYPNHILLVDSNEADSDGNTQVLMYENGGLLTSQKFSGVVYINELEFEVYSGVHLPKCGILFVNGTINWQIETPNQKRTKAHDEFLVQLNSLFKKIDSYPCAYPRITNYLIRKATESRYIAKYIGDNFLFIINANFDSTTEIETTLLKCKFCGSDYIWNYKESGIDVLYITKDACQLQIGAEIKIQAPNFLDALTDRLFCQISYLHRENLFENDLESLINYLFEKERY